MVGWTRSLVAWATGIAASIVSIPLWLQVTARAPDGLDAPWGWWLPPLVVALVGAAVGGRLARDPAEGMLQGGATAAWAWWLGLAPSLLWASQGAVWRRLSGGYAGSDLGREALQTAVGETLWVAATTFWGLAALGAGIGALTAPRHRDRSARPASLWSGPHLLFWTAVVTPGVFAGTHAVAENLERPLTLYAFEASTALMLTLGAGMTWENGLRLRAQGWPRLGALHLAWGVTLLVLLDLVGLAILGGSTVPWALLVPWLAAPVALVLARRAWPIRPPSSTELAQEAMWSLTLRAPLVMGPGGILAGLAISLVSVTAVEALVTGGPTPDWSTPPQTMIGYTLYGLLMLLPLDPLLLVPLALVGSTGNLSR